MTSDTLINAYFFVGGVLLILVLLGLIASAIFPGLSKNSKLFFISSFSILIFSLISYVIDIYIYTDPSLAWAERIVSFLETFLPSTLMPFLTSYILYYSKEDIKKSKLFYINISLLTLLFALLVSTQFTNAFYYFTEDNQFIRGDLYPILIIPMIGLILINLFAIIKKRNQLGKRHFVSFLIYLLPLLIVMIVQMFASVFILIVIAVSLSALSMLAIIMQEYIEQYLDQQRKIADQRASIAVLEMRPHFIYNTMTSIYYLCEQDAQKAQQVTLDFTTYLRKNFNAITNKDPIPFIEELEHTRAYLAVVKAQFEDNLVVTFDTPHTSFRLPPLTLQPLVENAVKYGMDSDAPEALSVSIKTEKTNTGNILVVEDNGPGISQDDNNEPHIALKNIRERLSAIGATLAISSHENGGTIINIFIPDKINN
ncbi:MAG: histidine kinase [Acholeplasmatales bacterium]|nr:histidine kinase [Acholeplasmatales bacterium]